MIAIKLNLDKSGDAHIRDVLRSILAHASSKDAYEIMKAEIPDDLFEEFKEIINFNAYEDTKPDILLMIPGDVLVLGYHWDKYIQYNLDNNKPIDSWEVVKRLGIFMRRGGDTRDEIQVIYKP